MEINTWVAGKDYIQDLNEEEVKWLKGLDLLDYYFLCRDEISYGNRNAIRNARKIENFVKQNRHLWPELISEIILMAEDYDWVRGPDLGDEDGPF